MIVCKFIIPTHTPCFSSSSTQNKLRATISPHAIIPIVLFPPLDKGRLGGVLDPFVEAENIAKEIKQRITLEVGDYLSCSVGIASNKLLAKIASDMQKPDGLVVVRPEEKYKLYDQLALIDIPGIGFRMERNLNKLGIYTLEDLRDYPKTMLVAQFGIPGHHLYQMGQLEGSWKENFEQAPLKSIGHMYTVTKEYRKASTFEPLLYKLSEMVATRLRVNKLSGNVLSVHAHLIPLLTSPKLGEEWAAGSPPNLGGARGSIQKQSGIKKFDCIGASRRLSYQLSDGRDIFLESRAIFRKGKKELKNFEVYLIGVTVASLTPEVDQPSLFASENNKLAVKALDKINEKYGDFTIARVPAFQARDIIRDSVGFGRMKEFKTTPARTKFGH